MAVFVLLKSGICMAALVCVTGLYYWGHCCIISVSGDGPSVLGYVYICNSGRASIITQIQNCVATKSGLQSKSKGPISVTTYLVNCNTEIFRRCFKMLMKAEKGYFLDSYCISVSSTSSEIEGLWFLSNKITFLVWFTDGLKGQFERGVQKVFNLCQ